MKRLKLIIVLLPLVLLLVSVGAFSWVMHTEPGAKWAWSMAGNSVPGTLNADGFSGNLSSGLAIRSLTYQDESIKVSTDDARLQLSIGLFPVTVILESVEAEHLLIHSTDTGDTNLEKNYAEILTALELPLALVFEKVRIAHLTYQERQGGPLFEGNDILLSGRWFKQLEIDQAQINTPLADWQINGLVGFASPFPVKLGINGAITLEQDNVQQSYQLDAQLDGDLTELGVVAQVEQPGISISGKLHHLLTRPAGDLIIQAQTLQWPLTNPTPEFSLHDVMAEVSGEINSYQAEITGLLAINNQPDTTIDFRGTGDEHSLTIERLNLSG
jgi:autotransporter translocation and assembly factor TamB